MRFLKKNYGLFLALILSLWAIKPFFASGFFPMHDDTQVARVFEMGKMLGVGVFPVRWVPDLGYGYGYPLFNFYAPLAYYAGGIFMLLGFDALAATKIMMGLGIIFAGIFMYFLAREFWGELGGAISGLFYLYAPYHALDIYVRGDVAESWAYAFIPLMALGFYKVFQGLKPEELEIDNSKFKIQNSIRQPADKIQKFGIVGALGYAGIILSHNLTALMITPFLLVAGLLLIIFSKKETRILNTLYLILYASLALVFSAFYWIPALLEFKNTNVLSQIGGGADFRDHFVCIGQLWDSLWGFGGSARGCIDGLSFKIGKLHIVVSVAALMFIFLAKNKNYNGYKRYIILLSLAGIVLSTFFTLELSKPIWEAIPTMAFFQYPWRFLILASFFSSFLSGFIVWFFQFSKPGLSIHFKPGLYTFVILAFILLFFNIKLFVPQTIFKASASDFTNEQTLKWATSKISDEYLPPNFEKPKNEKEVWQKPVPFQETAVQKASNAASFIGLLALIIGIIFKYAKSKR